MYYVEFGVTVYATHRSIHLTILAHLYEEWCNVRLIRRVSYDHVVWC